jgi:hypothetical protein
MIDIFVFFGRKGPEIRWRAKNKKNKKKLICGLPWLGLQTTRYGDFIAAPFYATMSEFSRTVRWGRYLCAARSFIDVREPSITAAQGARFDETQCRLLQVDQNNLKSKMCKINNDAR